MSRRSMTRLAPNSAATVGRQQQIPLSLIQYDPTASPPVKITNWSGADATLAASIVVGLINQGILSVAS